VPKEETQQKARAQCQASQLTQVTKHSCDDQMKDNKAGGAQSREGITKKYVYNFSRGSWRYETQRRPRRKKLSLTGLCRSGWLHITFS
jgi:hypothetical protein